MHLGINITLSEFTKVFGSSDGFPNSPLNENFTIDSGVNQTVPSCYTILSNNCLTISSNSCLEIEL